MSCGIPGFMTFCFLKKFGKCLPCTVLDIVESQYFNTKFALQTLFVYIVIFLFFPLSPNTLISSIPLYSRCLSLSLTLSSVHEAIIFSKLCLCFFLVLPFYYFMIAHVHVLCPSLKDLIFFWSTHRSTDTQKDPKTKLLEEQKIK